MPSFVVVAGADVEVADLEAGNGISARIDLNLHLAPPTTADFLRLGSDEDQQIHQHHHQPQQQRLGAGQEQQQQLQHLQRRILPRFGPGIHGVFLDLHQEPDSEPPFTGNFLGDAQLMRPPIRNRMRRYSRPVRIGALESRSSRRLQDVAGLRNQVLETSSVPKDKEPAKDADESKDDESSVKLGGGSDRFECNVCLDIAVDPVVTVCGHLFCWHCLYQWLYVHSEGEECPVCKGTVGENSIIPIYGRGSSSSAANQQQQQQHQLEEGGGGGGGGGGRVAIPPRPHARRIDSLRREDLDRESRYNRLWNLDEVLRMRRAIRFVQDNMGNLGSLPSRTRVLRRRMSERREHYRTPTAAAPPPPPPPAVPPAPAAAFAAGGGGVVEARPYEDYVRQLSATRAETEDRVASIRARLSSLVETIESHRRHAASVAAMLHQEPNLTLVVRQPGTSAAAAAAADLEEALAAPGPEPSFAVIATAESGGEVGEEVGQGSSSSGSGDVDSSELLHSRKRRRLN